jgi:hypothetical protein
MVFIRDKFSEIEYIKPDVCQTRAPLKARALPSKKMLHTVLEKPRLNVIKGNFRLLETSPLSDAVDSSSLAPSTKFPLQSIIGVNCWIILWRLTGRRLCH